MWTVSLRRCHHQADPSARVRLVEPKESDAGSIREEVRSQLANVVLPGQRLRRCGSSSIETGDEDCGKRETADHCTGQHRLWSDNGIGPRAATFPCLEDRGWSSRSSRRGLKGSQAWSNGEDWPPCTTRWPPDAVQATAGKTFPRQKLLSWKTFLTLQARENLETKTSRAQRRQVAQGYETCDAPGKRSRQHCNKCSWTSNKCVRIL